MTIGGPHICKEYVSVQAASQMLNVSCSSIQRLCDRGVFSFVKTSGGHRRISLASIAEYALSKKANRTVDVGIQPKMAAHQDLDVLSCLISGVIPQLIFWLKGTAKQVAHRLDNELCGAICQLDQACLQRSMEQEKLWLAIETTRAVLDAYKVELVPEQNAWPVAVGGTITGNFDWLGSRMVEICLRKCSMNAIGLGNNLTARDLAQAANDLKAKLVWLSYSHIENPADMIAWHRDLSSLLPKSIEVLIGGGAISPAIRRALPEHRYFESLSAMVDYLRAIDLGSVNQSSSNELNGIIPAVHWNDAETPRPLHLL